MGWLALLTTKMAHRTVTSTLQVASTEKLVSHYNACVESYRETEDQRCRVLLSDMQMKISEELDRRGVVTDIAKAVASS